MENEIRNAIRIDFNGKGIAGKHHGIGTADKPSNNFEDARHIADHWGIGTYAIIGNGKLPADLPHVNWMFVGIGEPMPILELNGCKVDGSRFENLVLEGAVNGKINVENCTLRAVTIMKTPEEYESAARKIWDREMVK